MSLAYLNPLPGMFRQRPLNKVGRKLREPSKSYLLDHVYYPKKGGIEVWKVQRLFPEKAIPYPPAVLDFNVLKKISLGFMSALAEKSAVMSILGFVFTPWKGKIKFLSKFLERYCDAAQILVGHHFILKRFYPTQLRELRTLVYVFLNTIGFSKFICSWISDIVMNFLYYDSAYYFKFVDTMSETSKENLLKNPSKEITRLYDITVKREKDAQNPGKVDTGVYVKLKPVAVLLKIMLLHPKIKKAFLTAVKLTDIEKLKADEADRYYSLLINNYNYMGQPFHVRAIVYQQMHIMAGHTSLPPLLEVINTV